MAPLLDAAARALWEAEEGRSWTDVPADERAALARDMEPVVRAVLAALASLPADARARLLQEAR